jgi:Fur family transcriptional regulator, ferric uptake regulator
VIDETLSEKEQIRSAGLKVTHPRMRILELLENSSKAHLSAEEVYRMLIESDEEIGLATVYRVLTQFEQSGILQRHNFETGHSVFELDRGEHHDHLLCVSCGMVEEFHDEQIEKLQHEVAERYDFKTIDHSLTIYGNCKECKNGR